MKATIGIDHGNKNIKTEHCTFNSGILEFDRVPPFGDYIKYNDKFYVLSIDRIPYLEDKTIDNRFFILTLFAIAMELEARNTFSPSYEEIEVDLAIGLPPGSYGQLYKEFTDYFTITEKINFQYKTNDFSIRITNVKSYPQAVSALFAIRNILSDGRYLIVDIGGYTADYVPFEIRDGNYTIHTVDSINNRGMIRVCTECISKVKKAFNITLHEETITALLKNEDKLPATITNSIKDTVKKTAVKCVVELISVLAERDIDVNSYSLIFIGGGSLTLKPYIRKTLESNLDIQIIENENISGYQISSLNLNAVGNELLMIAELMDEVDTHE